MIIVIIYADIFHSEPLNVQSRKKIPHFNSMETFFRNEQHLTVNMLHRKNIQHFKRKTSNFYILQLIAKKNNTNVNGLSGFYV
jgi:hypothetical protein